MKREHCTSYWSAALGALAIAGCEANTYEIVMTPNGETVQRELDSARIDRRSGREIERVPLDYT